MSLLRNSRLYFIYLLVASLISCDPNPVQEFDISKNIYKDSFNTITLKPQKDSIPLIIDSFDFEQALVFLDSSNPIGSIDKVQEYANRYFVLDRNNGGGLYCYNTKGDLIWKFGNKGNGAHQFKNLSDFQVKDSVIYGLDAFSMKVLKISFEGRLLKKLPIPKRKGFYPDNLFIGEYNRLFLYCLDMGDADDYRYEISVLDSSARSFLSFHLPKSTDPSVKRWGMEGSPIFPAVTDGDFYFTKALSDTIFSFENGTFKRKYYVEFGNDAIPPKYKKDKSFTFQKFIKSEYSGNIDKIADADSTLFFTFSRKGIIHYGVLDKISGVLKDCNLITLKIDNYFQMVSIAGATKGNIFIEIQPGNLLQHIKSIRRNFKHLSPKDFELKILTEYPNLYNIYRKVGPRSNPIIASLPLNLLKR